jgi:GNAT superfamily N-acetyltransferase
VKISAFDRINASASEYAAFHEFVNRVRAESWPEDPPATLEKTINDWKFIPPYRDLRAWVAWDKNKIIARSQIGVMRTPENQHLADFDVFVLPEWRGNQIAKRLLRHVVEVAQAENRRLLQTHTDSAIPSGETAVKRLGARMGLASLTNQLNLAALDKNLIRSWREQGEKRADEFEIGLWKGPFPEEELSKIIPLLEVMNTEPRENLEMEDWKLTPELVRQEEASHAKRKVERWVVYVRDRKTREFAGFTEIYWNPAEPETLYQGGTGVLPTYRNKGLGRWIKATMLEKVLQERPSVKRVRTGNANSNAPMLKINNELGFKPYKSWVDWQVETDKVFQYLNRITD